LLRICTLFQEQETELDVSALLRKTNTVKEKLIQQSGWSFFYLQ